MNNRKIRIRSKVIQILIFSPIAKYVVKVNFFSFKDRRMKFAPKCREFEAVLTGNE